MAWQISGNRAYYYKKVRIGNKVKSVYIGRDEGAQLIARVDQILRLAQHEVDKARLKPASKQRKR